MSDSKNGLFANTESDKDAEFAEAEKILETPLDDSEDDSPEKPKATKKRTPAADTVLKMELKRLIKQKALGTSGLDKLEKQKVALASQVEKLDAAITEAKAAGDSTELDAKIEKVKAELLEAIIASA